MTAARQRRYAPRLPPAERREQALDAALELIAQSGYGGFSMEAVARACGVTKPVLYELFANAGELAQTLLAREERRALADLAQAMPPVAPDADPDALLTRGVEVFLRAVHANPTRWRLILMPADGTPDQVRAHVERGRRTIADQLQGLVAWGIERRGGPAGLDVELAAQVIMGLGEHAARLVLTDAERYPPERVAAFAAAVVRSAAGSGVST